MPRDTRERWIEYRTDHGLEIQVSCLADARVHTLATGRSWLVPASMSREQAKLYIERNLKG
jgi:hypothetical protein